MMILNTAVLTKAGRKNIPLRNALAEWLELAERANWRNILDIRQTFRSADGVPVKIAGTGMVVATVFNIKGNDYRLVTTVNFRLATVVIREVLAHSEYSKNDWKGRL
jgi:mRNA interferase HigB